MIMIISVVHVSEQSILQTGRCAVFQRLFDKRMSSGYDITNTQRDLLRVLPSIVVLSRRSSVVFGDGFSAQNANLGELGTVAPKNKQDNLGQ